MIFLDSSFILALFNKNEVKNHEKTKKKLLETNPYINKIPKAINSIVLNEVLNKLRKSYYNNKREEIISLLSMDKIIYVTENDYKKAIKLYKKYDYTINYSDWLIIISMKKEGLTDIISFDNDFNKVKEINNIFI